MESSPTDDTLTTQEALIAPCGMNCALCVAYQFRQYDLNPKGFQRKYCPGCRPRGQNCLHMGDQCERLREGRVQFCYECPDFPCKRLKSLDKRYRTKYHLSMIENLEYIRDKGLSAFLNAEGKKWACEKCGSGMVCCHNGLCLACDSDFLVQHKRVRWGE